MLPLAIGACDALGGNVYISAFGIVALVAMMPVITIQVFGLVYEIKSRIAAAKVQLPVEEDTIIDFDAPPVIEEESYKKEATKS